MGKGHHQPMGQQMKALICKVCLSHQLATSLIDQLPWLRLLRPPSSMPLPLQAPPAQVTHLARHPLLDDPSGLRPSTHHVSAHAQFDSGLSTHQTLAFQHIRCSRTWLCGGVSDGSEVGHIAIREDRLFPVVQNKLLSSPADLSNALAMGLHVTQLS